MGREFTVAVCGATGAVGREMIAVLDEHEFPVGELRLLASERSEGTKFDYQGDEVTVHRLTPESFKGVDIALFSMGGKLSREYAPIAAQQGAVVVDNSSAWRMDPEVPLVVPEVNPRALAGWKQRRIIANPNCSTIQMVVVLQPLHAQAGLERVMVSTYQSVSGAGQQGIDELEGQTVALLAQKDYAPRKFPHRIAFNVMPGGWPPGAEGYNEEEWKMINETRKIMEMPGLRVSATCARVPVFHCHSESVNAEFARPISAAEARALLEKAPGVKVVDEPAEQLYPMPLLGTSEDVVLVGRIRRDLSSDKGLSFWVVADNLRKGAATNAVQIAEHLVRDYL